MTLQEVCKKYNIAESSMKNAFPRSQKALLKKYGVKIIKEGRGQKAVYREEWEDDKRALTMYNEIKDTMIMDHESFKLMNWDFMVFLAIVTTPMLVFRGSFEDFLRYVDVPISERNINSLKEALNSLQEREFISFVIDKTDSNYFVAALYRKVEEEMQIGIGMVKTCKLLAEKHKKRNWVPLLKTWLGVQILSEDQPYTVKDLEEITGLSSYQIRESNKILKESQIFRTSKAYSSYQHCIGTKVDMNADAFFNI